MTESNNTECNNIKNDDTENNTSPPEFAPLWRRLFSMFYDSILLVGIILFYSAIHVLIKVNVAGTEIVETSPTAAGDPFLLAGVTLTCCLFFIWFWTRNGQTLGMQSWRTRIESEEGGRISATQAITRLVLAPFSLLLLGAGYFWCLSKHKKTWHDLASKSRVVLVPKK